MHYITKKHLKPYLLIIYYVVLLSMFLRPSILATQVLAPYCVSHSNSAFGNRETWNPSRWQHLHKGHKWGNFGGVAASIYQHTPIRSPLQVDRASSTFLFGLCHSCKSINLLFEIVCLMSVLLIRTWVLWGRPWGPFHPLVMAAPPAPSPVHSMW